MLHILICLVSFHILFFLYSMQYINIAFCNKNKIIFLLLQESTPCHPWSTKLPKMAQPDLNYIAPEIQTCKTCSYFSDMFSFGIVICTIYHGETLIEAGYNGQQYLKQLDQVILFFLVVYYSTPLRIMFMISSFIPLFLCHCTRFLKYICFHINNLFFLKFVHRFRNHLKDYKGCSYLQINTISVTLLVEETAMPRENHRQTFYIQHRAHLLDISFPGFPIDTLF